MCKMLGYTAALAVPFGSFRFGNGTGEILLDEVFCKGTETNIGHCNHEPIGNYVTSRGPWDHSKDAKVICAPGILLSPFFRSTIVHQFNSIKDKCHKIHTISFCICVA